MSIIDAYLRLVSRWRWSFLLALLIGSFVLQAILPNGPVTRLTGFTLFMLIFGGALYAGRTGRRAAQSAIALLLATAALQILNVLGVATLEGPLAALTLAIVLGALLATFAELVGNRDATADSLVGAIFGYFVIATACALLFRQMEAAHPGSFRLPEGGDIDTQMLYFSLDHRDHRRLRRHHAGHVARPDLHRTRGGARHALPRHPDRPHRRPAQPWSATGGVAPGRAAAARCGPRRSALNAARPRFLSETRRTGQAAVTPPAATSSGRSRRRPEHRRGS